MGGCAKSVTIKTYSLDNGTNKMILTRKSVVKMRWVKANIRFVEPQYGPTEIEALPPKEGSRWGMAGVLFGEAISIAKSTLHWNVGDTQEDKTEINITGGGK